MNRVDAIDKCVKLDTPKVFVFILMVVSLAVNAVVTFEFFTGNCEVMPWLVNGFISGSLINLFNSIVAKQARLEDFF